MAARSDAPFGFKPWGTILRKNRYTVTDARAAIFKYDMMAMTASGEVIAAPAGDRTAVLGSAVALLDSNMVPTTYIAEEGNGYAIICDDPNQLYLVQEDLDSATLNYYDVGNQLNLISTHAGVTGTGRSRMEIDSSDISTDNHAQFKLVACHRDDRKESYASTHSRRWIVRANVHFLEGAGASGI